MTALGIARGQGQGQGHGQARGTSVSEGDRARSALSSTFLAAMALTLAGVLWVALGTMIAETGLRINQTVTERQELLARRASARLHLAQITHPDSLDARARALGFGSPPDAEGIAIVIQPGSMPIAAVPASERPLAFRLNARQALSTDEAAGAGARAGAGRLLGIFRSDEARR